MPAFIVVLVNVAVPLASVPVPNVVLVVESVKVTVSPSEGAVPVDVTFAVSVTLAPKATVPDDKVKVVVETPPTCCVSTLDVLVTKFVSPL